MNGRRLPDGFHLEDAEPGDYWKQPYSDAGVDGKRGRDWHWTIRDPRGVLGTLGSHKVEEHEDGTITVTPSILDPHDYSAEELAAIGVEAIAGPGWHGWLTRGVWTE